MFYSCPNAESFSLEAAEEWFFSVLRNLPSPNQLEILDLSWVIYHQSSRRDVERHMLPQFDNFMEKLKELITKRLTGLKKLRFETRTIWDCPDDGIYYPCADLAEYKELIERFRSSLIPDAEEAEDQGRHTSTSQASQHRQVEIILA